MHWGVVTNKHAWLTDPLLESLELARAGGLRRERRHRDAPQAPPRPPAPCMRLACRVAPSAAVYVGDSRSDIESGRAAGVTHRERGMGLSRPARPAETGWGADVDVDTPHDLLAWIRRALAGR